MACGWVKAHLSLPPATPPNSAAADRAAWSSQARGDSYPHESPSRAPKISQLFPELSRSRLTNFSLVKIQASAPGIPCCRSPGMPFLGYARICILECFKPQVILSHDPKTKVGPWISWKRIQACRWVKRHNPHPMQQFYRTFTPCLIHSTPCLLKSQFSLTFFTFHEMSSSATPKFHQAENLKLAI